MAAGPSRDFEDDARVVPAVHGRGRARFDAADRPYPRRPLERLGDARRHADLLPDVAAAAAGDEPDHARRDPVRLRGERRGDGCLDERTRRRSRTRAGQTDHVVAAWWLERGRVPLGGSGRDCSRGGSRPAAGEPVRRGCAVGGRAVDHWAAGERIGPFRSGEQVRAALACRAPDRRTVLPGDDDGGCDRRLERDLPPSRRRRERRGGGYRVYRLLPRDGRRAPRRRPAE